MKTRSVFSVTAARVAALVATLLLAPAPAPAGECDVSRDGRVSLADVQLLINCLLEVPGATCSADPNGDSRRSLADVQWIINNLLELPGFTCGAASTPFTSASVLRAPTQTEVVAIGSDPPVAAAKDEVLVHIKEDITPSEMDALKQRIAQSGGTIVGSLTETRTLQVAIAPGQSESAFIDTLKDRSGVASASLNEVVQPLVITTNEEGYAAYLARVAAGERLKGTPARFKTVTVPAFDGSYWVNQIRAAEAWAVTTGTRRAETRIAVVDTGLWAQQLIMNEGRIVRLDEGGNAVGDDDTALEWKGWHGLWVSAFAAGFRDSPSPVRGVSWNSDLLMVDTGHLQGNDMVLTDFLAGITTALNQGVRIINVSIGPGCGTKTNPCTPAQWLTKLEKFREESTGVVNAARRRNALIVFASGNEYVKNDNRLLPPVSLEITGWFTDPTSWGSNVLRVGASTQALNDADFSNMGSTVNLVAPGDDIGFTSGGLTVKLTNSKTGDGTSYAAPLVTGAAALVASVNPTLAAPEIRNILVSSAQPSLSTTTTPNQVLNVLAAVENAQATTGVSLTRLPEVSIGRDATASVELAVQVPATGVSALDLVFLVDRSGSYKDDIDSLQTKLGEIMANIRARRINVAFGVAGFADFPIDPYGDDGDAAFVLHQAVTADDTMVSSAVDGLDQPMMRGGDSPESQAEALYQIATGRGRDINGDGDQDDMGEIRPVNVGWRPGAMRMVILATDDTFHDSAAEPNYPGASKAVAIDALKRAGITVLGMDSGSTGGDLQAVVDATGGVKYLLSGDSREIADRIAQGVTQVLSQVDLRVRTISLGDWVTAVTPQEYLRVPAGESRSFTVQLTGRRYKGLLPQNYEVYLWVTANDTGVLKRFVVPVRVPCLLGCL